MRANIIDEDFIASLEGLSLDIKQPMKGLFGGTHRSRLYGSSAEFTDFREYEQGDDLRRIDWNLYARFEKLMLKLYTDERQLHHRIYIDASASMKWGIPSKADAALKTAAALGYLSVRALDRISLYAMHGQTCEEVFANIMGRENFYSAADRLNAIKFEGDNDFGAAILHDMRLGNDDGVSFIISDFLTDTDWQQAVDRILSVKRQVALIQILSQDELNPVAEGRVLLLDSEAADEDDLRNMKAELTRGRLRAYREAFEYSQGVLRDFCAARDVSLITLTSDSDPVESIMRGCCRI